MRLDLGCKVLQTDSLAVIVSRNVVILRLAQSAVYDSVSSDPRRPLQLDLPARLQYLDLSMVRISNQSLTDLLSLCRLLKKLSLEHVPLTDAVCQQIGQNRNMEALNLALCEGITVAGVKMMFTNFQKLLNLNISWTSLSHEALVVFCDTVTPTVLRLNISGCRKTMTDESKSRT